MLSQDNLGSLEHEKNLLQEAVETKKLKGSVVWEKVSCGKSRCQNCKGILRVHGPYAYLHYYSNHTVRKKYLGKRLADLLSQDKTALDERLVEVEAEIRRLMTSSPYLDFFGR